MRVERIIVTDPSEFAKTAASHICKSANAMAATQGIVSVALAGGLTPREVYAAIGNWDQSPGFPWETANFYFSDERCVRPDDSESNYKMACETLFVGRAESQKSVHRMPAERADREQAALDYESCLPRSLDLILLGIGSDGHIASLFPRSDALQERTRHVVVSCGPNPPRWRLTLTPAALRNAKNVLIMAKSSKKAWAVHEALEGTDDPTEIPARCARPAIWILDREAAGMLRKPKPEGACL
ncbi:6-phosphogluconolactonase [Candidatus Sumerlaeota bacterium]|nr:6-phosphogluconolactonase [Candidatus Sumerlaeota bacterium]